MREDEGTRGGVGRTEAARCGNGKTTGVKERGVAETGGKEKGVGETEGKTTGVKERRVGETIAKEWEVGETGGKGSGQNVMEGIEMKSYSAAVIEGVRKRARVFVGDSIVRKTDRVLNKGGDVVVCLPGAKIEAITERVKKIVGSVSARLNIQSGVMASFRVTVATDKITVRWDSTDVSTDTIFTIRLDSALKYNGKITSRSYTIRELDAGRTYSLQVNTTTNGRTKYPVGTQYTTKPNAASGLKTTAIETRSLTVTWHAPAGQVGHYEVQLKNKDETKQSIPENTRQATFNNLTPGTQYTVVVVTLAAGGRMAADTDGAAGGGGGGGGGGGELQVGGSMAADTDGAASCRWSYGCRHRWGS
ncbi:hypothetical protein LSAT2_032224 [Lamellibrachia satsuma]|nr:hypothetical protein LSAT2_032224 [Lamellibrachia satsuma]